MPAFYYALIFSIIGLVSDGCADASFTAAFKSAAACRQSSSD